MIFDRLLFSALCLLFVPCIHLQFFDRLRAALCLDTIHALLESHRYAPDALQNLILTVLDLVAAPY